MPSDILIIPNRNSTTAAPVMLFSGSQGNTIRLEVLTSGSVAFLGKSGSLFSISDNFSGSLMAVGDISGLPILEVFSDDRVVMGRFNSNALVVTGSNVGLGKSNPNPAARLDVSGSVFISGSTSITGSLTVSVPSGTAATFSTPGGGFVSFTNGLIDSNSSQFGFKAGSGVAAYVGANNSQHLTVTTAGNVAIGKTTANAVLDVVGNSIITGSLTVTGSQILASDGASATPGISFINDSNSGFFKVPAAPDVIYVGVNGGNTLRFAGSGLLYAGNSNAYLQLGNAGAVNINADGTNQNITLTPVGSGYVNVVQSASTTATNNYALTVGIAATSNLVTLGNHTNYAWLQSFNSRPLSINPLGNNVGIGPTAPAKALEVNRNNATTSIGSGEVVRIIGDDGNTLNTVTELGFGTGPTGGTYAPIVLGAVVTTNTGYNIKDFYIATRNTTTDTAPSERVRITGAGNVGIGKTPTTKLDVNGNVFITGSLSVTDGVAAPADYKNNLHPFLFITFL